MSNSVARPLPSTPRKPLAAGLRPDYGTERKELANGPEGPELDRKRRVGGWIERALQIAGMTKLQASQAMGYGDNQAPISRWIAGTENPQFHKLLLLGRRYEHGFVIAQAEDAGLGVEVDTVVRISRREIA